MWSSFDRDDRERGMIDEPPRRPMPVGCVRGDGVERLAPVRPAAVVKAGWDVEGAGGVGDGVEVGEVASGVLPGVPVVEVFEPTREELELRAMIVERQANKQLRSLLGVLDLTDDQQDRIFGVLARRSAYYHPALEFQSGAGVPLAAPRERAVVEREAEGEESAGEPGGLDSDAGGNDRGGAVDPIVAELEPEQVEVYERQLSERESFWAGVVNDIEHKLGTNGR
jgi:hypothetical protein